MAITRSKPAGRKELRIGLLGCGFMGKCHTNAYKKIPYIYPAAEIAAPAAVLCDQQADIAEREAARYGYEEYCTDWHELAADRRIDMFDNCGPDPVHPEPCIAALAARQARDLREADGHPRRGRPADARRAAAAAKGKSMCTFNYRFMPAVRFAKDLITEGRIGTLYQIRVHYLQMAGHDPSLPPERSGTRPGRTRAASRGSAATPSTSAASWSARSAASPPWCGPSTRSGPSPAPAARPM